MLQLIKTTFPMRCLDGAFFILYVFPIHPDFNIVVHLGYRLGTRLQLVHATYEGCQYANLPRAPTEV